MQLERGECVSEVLDRAHGLAGLCVVQDHVALAEGAALGVLSGEAQRDALGQQRGKGERLGVRPVDVRRGALGERVATAIELFDELGMHREAIGHPQQLIAQLAQARGGHGRVDLGARGAVELVLAGAMLAAMLGGRGDLCLQALVQQREVVPHLLCLLLDLLGGDDPLGLEAVGPEL